MGEIQQYSISLSTSDPRFTFCFRMSQSGNSKNAKGQNTGGASLPDDLAGLDLTPKETTSGQAGKKEKQRAVASKDDTLAVIVKKLGQLDTEIKTMVRKNDAHHELMGGKILGLTQSVAKLSDRISYLEGLFAVQRESLSEVRQAGPSKVVKKTPRFDW